MLSLFVFVCVKEGPREPVICLLVAQTEDRMTSPDY